MGRVLVTGATGNVGSQVVRALNERGGEPFEAPGFDFEDPSTFASTVENCDLLFLLRPPPHPFDTSARAFAGTSGTCAGRRCRPRRSPCRPSYTYGLRRGQAAEVDPTLGALLGRPPRTMEQFVAANCEAF
jgi:hypothetical protein